MEKEEKRVIFHSHVFAWFLDLVNESQFIGYIILDPRFLGHFWRTLWKKMGTKLQFSSAYQPQTNGKTEIVSRSLGNLLRSNVGEKTKKWDLPLPQVEFDYNSSMDISRGKSPFQVVYNRNPMGVLDLVQLPLGDRINDDG
jgi:hypothetical protein